ncbi:MAG: ABC transporter permease [Thiohalocapsa sp.]
MTLRDFLFLSLNAVSAQPMRTFLTSLGIAVGIAAVVLLTAIGEGIRLFVLSEFTEFGTNVISITPGKTLTRGTAGGANASVRPLTLEDAHAVTRLAGVRAVVPIIRGSAQVKLGNRSRNSTIAGVGPDLPALWRVSVGKGRFLPAGNFESARPFVVLGRHLAQELFNDRNPLGQVVRVAGEPYRVIGVMASKGEMLGVDVDDTAFIPTGGAMAMFNRDGLMEIGVLFGTRVDEQKLGQRLRALLTKRHGNDDFTVATQDEMLNRLGSVLAIVTITIAGLGGISLVVGGVGIMTIMTISVSERTAEIGLMRAIGSKRRHILLLFLIEAIVLAGLGGTAGLLIGIGGAWALGLAIPYLPINISVSYAGAAVGLSVLIGLVAGVAPARNAAGMNPVEALRSE